jgi:glutamate-1-semialdehyde-2,1-aminomutase
MAVEERAESKNIEDRNVERLPESSKILERAKRVLLSPTVTGPFRAPKAVAFVKEARGSRVIDVDGNEYVDITMAYGPLILGHSHPVVVKAIQQACTNGTVYDIAHEPEVAMAELMVESIPCAERVTFNNSGTEATMHAMRIARARTGKEKIAKFEGGYHGVHDYALVSGLLSTPVGSLEDPGSVPDNPGIPRAVVDSVITLSYDVSASLDKIRRHQDELAAVIVEPVPSAYLVDLGEFLHALRAVTEECGVLLILDEVISGYRLAYGGAQEYFGVIPDIATYGKIMGGGLPVGAVAGSADAMQPLITTGNPLQDIEEKLLTVGTFSGNPLTMIAGKAVLEHLRDNPGIYEHINGLAERIKSQVHEFASEGKFPLRLLGLGSWFIPHFVPEDPKNPRDLRGVEGLVRQEILCQYMRYHGVYLPDLHTGFICSEHTEEDANHVVDAFKRSLLGMREDGLL